MKSLKNEEKTLKSDIILKTDSDTLLSQSIIDDIKSLSILRELSMSD